MFLEQITSAGSLPALAAAMQFAGQRQRLIAHNVANLETPDFRPVDVSPAHFQSVLRGAIDARRKVNGGSHGELAWSETRELRRGEGGEGFALKPRTPSGNILFHDRNNRDLERTMQAMVENAGAYRVASELMKARGGVLVSAMAERVA